MAETVQMDAGSGLMVSGALALPINSEHSARHRATLALRRWWKEQQVSHIEDKVVDRDGIRSSSRLTLPLVLPVLGVLALLVWREPENQVAFLSLVYGTAAILYSMASESVERRITQNFWLQLANCAVYAAIITALMWTFLTYDHPRAHTHWIIFFIYFLLIGGMGLSDDPRHAVCAGAFSIVGYVSSSIMLHHAADMGTPMAIQLAPQFEWVANCSKVALLCAATFLAATSASRGRSLRRTSFRDGLTGLHNRHAFDVCLGLVAQRSEKQDRRMTIAMVDIDHFKRVNDDYGHIAGDAVLSWVASWLQRSFRANDLVARYGGEEFVIAFSESDHEKIEERLEFLRSGIDSTSLRQAADGPDIHISISIGTARMPRDGSTAAEVLALADARLFEAKRSGRNRIVSA